MLTAMRRAHNSSRSGASAIVATHRGIDGRIPGTNSGYVHTKLRTSRAITVIECERQYFLIFVLMQLQMKTRCAKCGATLQADGAAYICCYECTFCSECAAEFKSRCPNCTNELVRRPRREGFIAGAESGVPEEAGEIQPWLVWVASFGAWMLVVLAATVESYEWWKSHGNYMSFGSILGLQLSQILTYAPLTPLVFALATRFPIKKENWVRRSFLHLCCSVAFSIAHVTLRGLTPFAAWDAKAGGFVSGIWNSQAHMFEIKWHIFENLFFSNVVDDITGAYIPIVLVAQACLYYRRLRDREVHSAKLEMQLARSHLQALKSHLRPHFLFNTMHSISALMLTDVSAADKMMSRLSDLLRMSFESNGTQLTSLNRELEFVNGYLEIEKIRLGERLKVVLDIAPETLDAQVPSLLLQPLVENAIRHGISKLSSGGTIWIISSQDGRDLHLQVKDNGPGLVKVDDGPFRAGLGLRTTRDRLQTLYGNKQSFEISSAASGGVEVRASIPFRDEPQVSKDDVIFARAAIVE
jgi:two-component system LytT family sensor kinase